MTPAQHRYRYQYLKSKEWLRLRNARLKMNRGLYGGDVCECCMVPYEKGWRNGHHVTYPQDWYQTTIYQIRMVCVPCHTYIHKLIDKGKIPRGVHVEIAWQATLKLCRGHRGRMQKKWQARLAKRALRKQARQLS